MMVNIEGMKLVFRLHGIGFSLPVKYLLEISDESFAWQAAGAETGAREWCGQVTWRGQELPVLDLGSRLGMAAVADATSATLLVLHGRYHPCGALVDGVEGIFPAEEFNLMPLPLLLQNRKLPFRELAIWRHEPLVDIGEELLTWCRARE